MGRELEVKGVRRRKNDSFDDRKLDEMMTDRPIDLLID